MKATSEMSHTRPFRWRRKHQAEEQATTTTTKRQDEDQSQHLTLRSSAIGEHHHHHHQHPLSCERSRMSEDTNARVGPLPAAQTPSSTSTHSRRYSPETRTEIEAATSRRRGRPILAASPAAAPFSLPSLMSLSIFACVILSLLNLTIDRMQPKMVVAIGAGGTAGAAPASAAGGGASPNPSQSSATLQQQQQQQQQQSNSVIQYPAASNAPKTKYKTMYACEDRQLTMDCESGSKINLIRANFGRFSITQCNEQGQLDLSTDCMSPITFRIMQERCQDRQRCSVNATSVLFGDRCPKTRKYLEVHFQCQMVEPDVVDVRKSGPGMGAGTLAQQVPIHGPIIGASKPPNNPAPFAGPRHQQPALGDDTLAHPPASSYQPSPAPADVANPNSNQLSTPVINSQLMTSAMAINGNSQFDVTNKLPDLDASREPIIVSLRHLQIENMSRPRCYQWDSLSRQWTDKGAHILETNQTHTTCAFDQQSSYVLVMDYSGPIQLISPKQPPQPPQQQPSHSNMNGPPDLLESQPVPIDNYLQPSSFVPPTANDEGAKMIHPPASDPQHHHQHQQQQQQHQDSSARLFLYLLGIVFVAVALMTLTFVASSMRSSAGAALKSLGNFAPFSGPKYKHRRQNVDQPSLHSNKDLLVVNNSNGHSFIYAPASTTKISSSSSTHILSAGGQPPAGLGGGQHQAGTLHRLQQQQMYSGNGATLSSLSGTGAQSNNYYYGLMGLNPLLQQQQQQLHFSQHHLNQQPQQAQLVGHQQQQQTGASAPSYSHQANKSSVSNESANSSASSSGVESGSTSMQQQQQARTQQACLVSAMNNNDFHLMGHHISNYGQHQPQQHNLFATLKGASVTHQPHHHQPTFTVNAHYSTSGGIVNGIGAPSAGLQSINMTSNQAPGANGAMLHTRQPSNQMRDHIYECVDDDKTYMARLLMPTQSNSQQQIFGSPSFTPAARRMPNECGARQK